MDWDWNPDTTRANREPMSQACTREKDDNTERASVNVRQVNKHTHAAKTIVPQTARTVRETRPRT